MDQEEEKRKEIDREEEALKSKSNANILKRAKDLQYEEKDKVKFLRSQQLYTDVVATRNQQMKEKEDKKIKLIEEERKWHEKTLQMIQEAEIKDKLKSTLQKKRAMEIAEDMKNQRNENEKQKKIMMEKQRKSEEELIKRAQVEHAAMEERDRQRKNDLRRKNKEEMEMLFMDIENKNKANEEKEKEDEKKRKKDIERMEFVAFARSQLELKHFEERQKTRKILSDRAAEELKIRSNREVEIFIREQKEQESKERARKEEEARRKEQREREIHESRQEQIRLRKERKQKEIDKEKLIIDEYQKMTLDEIAQEKKKENDIRERHNQMRHFQIKQIEEKRQSRIQEKQSQFLEATKVSTVFLFVWYA